MLDCTECVKSGIFLSWFRKRTECGVIVGGLERGGQNVLCMQLKLLKAPSTDVLLKECLDSFMRGLKNSPAGDKIFFKNLSPNKNPLTTGPQRPAIFSDTFLKMGAEQLPKTRMTDNRICTNFTPAKVKTRTESRIENGHVSESTDEMWKGGTSGRSME